MTAPLGCTSTKVKLGAEAVFDVQSGIILIARLSLVALFLIFGWRKLRDYPGTVSQMARDHLPAPALVAVASTCMELGVGFTVAVGLLTRPLAVLFALYTMGTSLAEHRYWRTTGAARIELMEAFYKNLSIIGGFLLLAVTGPGRYSLDWLFHIPGR
jgi:putative oxidoreductase